MHLKTHNWQQLVQYILIIALFYVTGGSFSYINYSAQITAFFLVSLLLVFLCNKKLVVTRNSVFNICILSFFVLLPGIVFRDKISTYIAIIMQLFIGFFISNIIDISSFKNKYINVITSFALISLLGFIAGLFFPRIAYFFPVIDKGEGASVIYYNAYVYIFMVFKGYGSLVLLNRNAGICWEPGCYQMFLNMALFFLLESNYKRDRNFYIKLFILIITIITTFSTTGYIIAALIILVLRKRIAYGNQILVGMLFVLIIFTAMSFFSAGSIITNKILGEINGTSAQSFSSRMSLEAIPRIFENYFIGIGFTKWLEYNEPMWNSVIHSFICLGTPFTLIHLYNLFRGAKKLSKYGLLLFLIMVLCAFTETLFWRPLYDTIAFYGLALINEEKNLYESFNSRCTYN